MANTSRTSRLTEREIFYFRQRYKNRVFQAVAAFFAARAEGGLTKSELAARLGKDPAQVTRWFSGPGNWTLETVSDLLLAMNAEMSSEVLELHAKEPQGEPFIVRSAVLCDDIRREHNGKLLLIGVYAGALTLQKAPATLHLSLLLEALATADSSSLELKTVTICTAPEESFESTRALNEFQASKGSPFGVVVERIPVRIMGPGHVSIQAKFGDGDWTEVIRKPVMIQAQPGLAESPEGVPGT